MKELLTGKYELPETWSIDKLEWLIKYDTIENGKPITKTLSLHPNCYNDAKVGEPCIFYILNAPNLHNGGKWEEFAVIGKPHTKTKERTDIATLITQLIQVVKITDLFTEDEVKEILIETIKKLKHGK